MADVFEDTYWAEYCLCTGLHGCPCMKDRSKKVSSPPNGVHEMAVAKSHKSLRKCKLCKDFEVYTCSENNFRVPPTFLDLGQYPPGSHGVPEHLRELLRQKLAIGAAPAGAAAEGTLPADMMLVRPYIEGAAEAAVATMTKHFETFYTMSAALAQQNAVLIGQNAVLIEQNAVLIEQTSNPSESIDDAVIVNQISESSEPSGLQVQ
jgi:hypothetical protein